MQFDWYQLFNYMTFLNDGLVSRTLTVVLDGVGQRNILIVKGNEVSIVYEDVILPVLFENENPFISEGDLAHYAVYKDSDENIWLGIEA